MATYGQGKMLGSGINPESFKQDYSGFTRAADIQAQGMSNLGASIGGAIKMIGDEKKQINQDIAKGKSALQFAKANYPELAGRIDEIGKIFSDVNVSKADQAAAGSQMGDFVTAMIRGQEFNTEVGLKKRALDIEEASNIQSAKTRQAEINAAANKPGSLENIAVPGGTQQMVRNSRTGVFEPIKIIEESTSSLSNLPDALKPFSKDFETAGARYGVNPKLLAAIAMHETGNGTSSAFRNKNNAMGVSDASGPVEMGSVAASIDKMANLLGKGINEGVGPYANAQSIEDIANIYAPPGAGNDPRNLNQFWTQGVTSNIQKLSGNKTEQVEPTSQNQGRVGFTPEKSKLTSRIITGDEAVKLGGDSKKKYIIKEAGDEVSEMTVIPPDMTPAEERARAKEEGEKTQTKRAGELAVKSINKFIDGQGNYNASLDSAVGYGENLATGVAQYAPIFGTQSPQERANQKELKILIEKGILEAASLLKPVSNVDLQLLKDNRPEITDPPELWARWLNDVRGILDNPSSYAESGTPATPATPTAPMTPGQRLKGLTIQKSQ
jgi:hypothetical protein